MMAVVEAAVVTMMAGALTLGGHCGSYSIGEAESSKGGVVLHLQALGGSVGCGAVDNQQRRAQERGRGGIVTVVAELTVEGADSCPPC
jgi:hypothetical protein